MGEKYTQLTEGERNQIYALRKGGKGQREIACILNRSPSTISRELRRNSGRRGYRPKQAQSLARERRSQPRTRKMTEEIIRHIEARLEDDWSPEQISGKMKQTLPVAVNRWFFGAGSTGDAPCGVASRACASAPVCRLLWFFGRDYNRVVESG